MLSVPVAIDRVTYENMDAHIEEFKRIHADRVFLCLFKNFMDGREELDEQLKKFGAFRERIHAAGMEAGIWLDILGHASAGIGYKVANKRYTPLEGVFGKCKDSFCPLDKKFEKDYKAYIKRIAEAGPDIIMFDDDYRFSVRSYGIGCFCKEHRKLIAEKTGKRRTKIGLFNKVFSGPANPERDAWMNVMGESLIGFARSMRETVDGVDEKIRLGCCMCLDTLDLDGTNALELAKAFAGRTKPYFRTIGAPYWHVCAEWGDSRAVAEYTRQEMAWFDGEDVEMFAEGDVFPRPRYVVPSAYLECYDAYLHADGRGGILKYMFDYKYELGYETGYLDHHVKNYDVMKAVAEAFRGKKQVGVELYEPMQKIRTWDFDKTLLPQKDLLSPPPTGKGARFFDGLIRKPYYSVWNVFEKMQRIPGYSFGLAQRLIAANGIPTVYAKGDGAVVCFGESARSLPEEYLSRGLVLDSRAAKILTERGFGVGFVSDKIVQPKQEEYTFGSDLTLPKRNFLRALICDSKAEAVSYYRPSGEVASYFYVNEKGQSFYVLGVDSVYLPLKGEDAYFINYYRARAIKENLTRVAGKKLVACSDKNINLTLLCARGDDGSLTVGLFNFFIDGIVLPKIEISEPISDVSFINCSGRVVEGGVVLDEIPSYGFACFTVRK
ncbi:MAG: hypothetical protein J5781_08160 [Clostridia bacterium]|nr:hypothetical protein [Clostridia bacterium]